MMSQCEINSLYYQIHTKTEKINSLKEEINTLENQINQTKTENKTLCAKEYDFIYQILDNEKKMFELIGEREKNLSVLNNLKAIYKGWTEKLGNMNKIKAKIISSNQRKKKCLMRKVFQLKKFNEESQIEEKLIQLRKFCFSSGFRNFTLEESIIFSTMFDRLKVFYLKQKEKIKQLAAETGEKAKILQKEADNFKSKVWELLSLISMSYTDIKIPDFTNMGIAQLSDLLTNVNSQIVNKFEFLEASKFELEQELDNLKTEFKKSSKRIVAQFDEMRDIKYKKKSFLILKQFAQLRIKRKARQMEAEKEREKLRELEKDPLKENESLRLVKKSNLDTQNNLLMRNNNVINNNSVSNNDNNIILESSHNNLNFYNNKNLLEENNMVERKERTRRKRGVKEEKKVTTDKVDQKVEKVENKKNSSSLANQLISLTSHGNKVDLYNNLKVRNNNFPPSPTAQANQMSSLALRKNTQPFQPNVRQNNSSSNLGNVNTAKHNFRIDIPTLEESFSKKAGGDNILDEISKNIDEVSEFPPKNTFGGKKKYMSLI